jgi:hypothetical protein
MVNVLDSALLTLLKLSGVSNTEQLEAFCNRYNYSVSTALTDVIRVYMDAVSRFEQQRAEEQVYGAKPRISVGVNV